MEKVPSKREKFLERQTRREIEEAISLFLRTPRSKEGIHRELRDAFEITETENPLKREFLEENIRDFIGRNLETFVPLLIRRWWTDEHSEFLKKTRITNEDLVLWGTGYRIGWLNNQPCIFVGSPYTQESVSSMDLIALAYLKENIRVDSLLESGRVSGKVPHRYYYKPLGRYLCSNDFGMRVFSEREGRMKRGDAAKLTPFFETVKLQMSRINSNLESILHSSVPMSKVETEEKRQKTDWGFLMELLKNPKIEILF